VEAAIGTPHPSPSAATAVVLPNTTQSPPSRPFRNDFVPSFAASVTGPEALAFDPDVLLTNVLMTILFVFMFGLTSEIFNSTMDSNRAEIEGWWGRVVRGPLRFLRPVLRADSMLDRLSASGPAGVAIHALVVLVLVGVIYGFLSPDFGLNGKSLVLFISLVFGLGFVTYFTEGSASLLAIRRYRAHASVQLYGTAVLVAIVSVIASRFINFSPGLVYGFIASSLIMAPVALAKRDEALLVLLPAIGLLIISLVAWVLLQPVRTAAGDGSWLAALLDTILAMIVVAGLEGLFFTLIPLRFMDGAILMRWSRVAWALLFGTVTFLWWQLLLNQNGAYAAAFRQTSVQLVVAVLLLFMLTTGGIWTFFRFRARTEELAA